MSEEQNNELDNEKSFAELFEDTAMRRDFLKPGQRIEATVVKITGEWIFLDLGEKSEGYLDRKELSDEEGNLSVKEGDTLAAYFVSSKANEKLFTTKIGVGDSARNFMEEAWRSGIPVEGVVEKETKGGFEIKLAGSLRAFCPYSQMGLQRIETPADFIGTRVTFKILEFGEKGRNIILSSRVIAEEKKKKEEEALKETLREGMVVQGTVVSIKDYGAFVDIGGIQGLLPISEIGWERVEDIRSRLSVGQTLEVALAKLDWENNRISLSVKQTLADPWKDVEALFKPGTTYAGTVVRLTKFGAFVNIGQGIDGLLHISKLGRGKRIAHPQDVLTEGQSIDVQLDKIDLEQKRISLSLPADEFSSAQGRGSSKGSGDDYKEFIGNASASFGSFGDMLKRKQAKKDQ